MIGKKLRLGVVDYTTAYDSSLPSDKASEIDFNLARIRFSDDWCDQEMVLHVLHEIFHEFGRRQMVEMTEPQTEMFAQSLAALLRDAAPWINWMTRRLQGKP